MTKNKYTKPITLEMINEVLKDMVPFTHPIITSPENMKVFDQALKDYAKGLIEKSIESHKALDVDIDESDFDDIVNPYKS